MMLARETETPLKTTPLHALARRQRRQDGAVRRLRHAGAIRHRRAQGTPAYPRLCRAVRRLAYGPDRAAGEIRQGRGCGAGAGAAGAAGHPWRCAGPAALRPVHQRRRRHPRRPDGGEFRQPSVPGGQRRLQGRGRGASARAPVGQLHHRAAGRSRADRAAGAEGRIGTGQALPRGIGDAVHGYRAAPRRRHRLLRLALGLYRRGRF